MAGENPAHRIIDDGQNIMDSSKRIMQDAHEIYEKVRGQSSMRQMYQDNPFAMLAAAAGVGYLLGGGLFTPFTRRIARIGIKGLVIPIAGSQLKQMGGAQLGSDDHGFTMGE